MANSKQVAPPGEKPARRCVIPPALGEEYFPFLSFVKRPVRTRMRGVVGAGEGDLPGYPIRFPPRVQQQQYSTLPSWRWSCRYGRGPCGGPQGSRAPALRSHRNSAR